MSFTILEYAKEKGLDLDPKDTKQMKMMAQHLRKLGYEPHRTRTGGKQAMIWVKGNRTQQREKLADALTKLEGNGRA